MLNLLARELKCLHKGHLVVDARLGLLAQLLGQAWLQLLEQALKWALCIVLDLMLQVDHLLDPLRLALQPMRYLWKCVLPGNTLLIDLHGDFLEQVFKLDNDTRTILVSMLANLAEVQFEGKASLVDLLKLIAC